MPAVLITGASRGLGRELFRIYQDRGWTTFPLVRDRRVAGDLESSFAPCHPIVADVGTEEVEGAITSALEAHAGSLDVLINNAGHVKKLRGLENTTPEDLEDLFRVHCVGVFRCTRAALPFLERAERPVVVNISSRKGSISRTSAGEWTRIFSYPVAKCAQNMLSTCFDLELGDRGIRVFAVHPGGLKTDVAPPDADTDPADAARALVDWIDRVDDRVPYGFHDIMGGGLLEW